MGSSSLNNYQLKSLALTAGEKIFLEKTNPEALKKVEEEKELKPLDIFCPLDIPEPLKTIVAIEMIGS